MLALDHVVFNTRDRMDEVVALFERIGFTVAPRGFHTLGSINHVIAFGSDYLELLGYPKGKPPAQRPELAAHPVGLMATVLATADADATRAALLQRGLAPRPVQTFSRPVDLGAQGMHDATFRVTRLEPNAAPGTWFYYCQHLTPELVWRPEWQAHANQTTGMAALEYAVPQVGAAHTVYAACLLGEVPEKTAETVGGSHSTGTLALRQCSLSLMQSNRPAGMTGLSFAVPSLAPVQAHLRTAGVRFARSDTALILDPDETFGVTLQFLAVAR